MDGTPQGRQGHSPVPSSPVYLYICLGITAYDAAHAPIAATLEQTGHRLVSFVRDEGRLHLEGHSIPAEKGACILLAPGAKARIELNGGTELKGAAYVTSFHAYLFGQTEPAADLGLFLPYETKIGVTPVSQLVTLIEQIAENTDGESSYDYTASFKRQIRLQELLALLMDNVRAAIAMPDAKLAVQQSVAYLNQNYREEITVEKLSKMCGVGRRQYSALFQSLTGKKPLDYLTGVRLERAKEMLLSTDDPLRAISRSVGFKDEYYFNRKFRHTMGLSPKKYAQTKGLRLPPADDGGSSPFSRVVAVGYALGDLLSLGIRPVGADMTVIGKKAVYRYELQGIADIGLLGEPGKVRALAPDLIVYSSFRTDWMMELSGIAPTVCINRYEPTYERLLKVADLFGRQDAARDWIADHQRKSEEVWTQLSGRVGKRETAAIFVVSGDGLYVMGMKGIALTLYHPLAFKPADKVREMMADNVPFRSISPDQVIEYDADRLFLLVDESKRAKREALRLVNSPSWFMLGAVAQNRVHIADAKWNLDDPITMDRLLPLLPDMLR